MEKIVVIGAGPAGMMASIRASEAGGEVILIEKNPILGKKLLLTGKERCNLTNACTLDEFLERFSGNKEFLRDAFKKFFNKDLMDFFENRGLRLKIERQGRVFPATDRSDSIVEVLKKELLKHDVKTYFGSTVKDVLVDKDAIKGVKLQDGQEILASKVILTTGGVSYGFTGSTGDGINIAKRLGHRIIDIRPGLVALETKESYPKKLEGLTLKNVTLNFSCGKKQIGSDIGELLFTDFGVSGPLVLSLSGKAVDLLKDGTVKLEIDLKPAPSKEELEKRILKDFKDSPTKIFKNALKALAPIRLIDVIIDILKASPDKKVNQITQIERKNLVNILKSFPLTIKGPRPIKDAMVTRGGVSLKDIDPRTMESRLIKGLYFAGEVIDIDADTGGFNLQAAFSTGYLAGESAALS
ncbi:MAG: NAD(P)/FAD-dependent oxidoreductase [Candidatus Omnitrophota bacterium]